MSADSAALLTVLKVLAGPEVQTLLSARYVVIALGTIISWETLLHFHHDVRIVRKLFSSRTRRSFRFGDAIFLIIRYSLIWYLVSGGLFFFGRPASCTAVKYNVAFSILTGIIAMEALFLFRVYLIWGRNKWIAGALGSLILLDFSMNVTVAVVSPVAKYPDVPEPFPWCTLAPFTGPFGEWNWLPRVVYDFLILAVTMLRLWTMPKIEGSKAQSLMRKWIVNSNATYFALVFCIYLTGLIGTRVNHQIAAGLIWATLAQGLPLVIGARLILFTPSRQEELKGAAQYGKGGSGGTYPGTYNTSSLPRVHPRPSPRQSDSIAASNTHRRRTDPAFGSGGGRMDEATGSFSATSDIMILPPAKLASETSFFGSATGSPRMTTTSSDFKEASTLQSSPLPKASVNEAQLEEAGWVLQRAELDYVDPAIVDFVVDTPSPRPADVEFSAGQDQRR